MTISLVLFSARHCLFPARFRLAYYRALLPPCSSPFSLVQPPPPVLRRKPPTPLHPLLFLSRPSVESLPCFLAGPQLGSVCLRRVSIRRPTIGVSSRRRVIVAGPTPTPSFRRSAEVFVRDNRSENGFRFSAGPAEGDRSSPPAEPTTEERVRPISAESVVL